MDDRSKPAQRNDIPKIDAANNEAARGLRAVEAGAASDKPKETGDNLDANRANEEAANGFYTGTGRELVSVKGKGKGKFSLKGKGPIGLIIALIMGFGGLFAGAQLFQPFSLVEQFREAFNSMHVSTNRRSNAFFKMQMGTGKYKNPLKGTLFRGDTFNISTKQRNRLQKQGIEVEGSGSSTVLKYTDASGDLKTVTASEFKSVYQNDPDFFNKYNAGSMTWRGAISNWFGTVTANFLSKNRITRNIFKDFIEKVKGSEDGDSRRVALDIMSKGTDEVKGGGFETQKSQDDTEKEPRIGEDGKPVIGEDGKPVYDDVTVEKYGSKTRQNLNGFDRLSIKSESDAMAKLKVISDAASGGSIDNASKLVNFGCLAANFLGGVTLVVNAAEALKIMGLTTSFLEAIDKTKAGLADESPINELSSTLNEPKLNEHTLYGESSESSGLDKTTTAIEGESLAALYERRAVNGNDRSVQSFNFAGNISRVFKNQGGLLGGLLSVMGNDAGSMATFEKCAIAKIATNTLSAIGDLAKAVKIGSCLVGLVASIFTFGATAVATCLPILGDVALKIAAGAAMGALISGIISIITPIFTKIMMRDIIGDIGGEDLGNALVSGANMYLGNTHRTNGGSLANPQKYTEFALAQQEVIAENARYERMNRSPFDTTSKYTFMGTLLTNMMSFLSANSLMSTISTASSVVSSSVVALATPTARAFDINSTLPNWDEYEDTCPYLYSIGAVGDQFCNPYSITDVTTLEEDPAEIQNRVEQYRPVLKATIDDNDNITNAVLSKNFLDDTRNDNGIEVVQVNSKSDLAKYILYCDNRASAFGYADQNIVSEVSSFGNVETGNALKNAKVNGGIGSIPIIGDLIDITQNTQALLNAGYISGKTCVAGNETKSFVTPDWEDAKNYQRFIEDQSLAESSGLIEKSAVTAFLEEWYEEHPLDNSYEGIIARYSGLSKDTVVAIFDVMEYGNYIANYDPSTRHQFGEPEVVMPDQILFDTESTIAEAPAVILTNAISFADVRNRAFVV